ncbi:hypothetical protein B0T16DRAFT_396831 [Cercophora newfieldiana]|uniref:Uncharacterized protein n=1 Tax=Cercophora newfieldiana TaxID=92897 RepID=A0AA39YP22_9PEZI|nr:hypothetical protein B0T16DRAFT_396831 [Cercophora newfieldiana]
MRIWPTICLASSAMAFFPRLPGLAPKGSLGGIPKLFEDGGMEFGRRTGLIKPGNGEWPVYKTVPTYDPAFNLTEANWVGHCIAQWCDTDEFLNPHYGRIACRTPSDRPGGGALAFICNQGAKARCSRVQIGKVMYTLQEKTGFYSGYIDLHTGPAIHMIIGFDTYCNGDTCGVARNPMWAACENPQARHREPMQLDIEITAEDVYGKQEKEEYMGITWVDKPTPTPTGPSVSYSTVTPSV